MSPARVDRLVFMSFWFRDLRYACRMLRRQPAFSGVAILTLALGIGATTAVFTVVYGVLLRPLPYRDPARLMLLVYGHQGRVSPWLSPLNFGDYVAQSDVARVTERRPTISRSCSFREGKRTRLSAFYKAF